MCNPKYMAYLKSKPLRRNKETNADYPNSTCQCSLLDTVKMSNYFTLVSWQAKLETENFFRRFLCAKTF